VILSSWQAYDNVYLFWQIDFLNQELAVRESQLQALQDKEVGLVCFLHLHSRSEGLIFGVLFIQTQGSREARKALQNTLGQVQKENVRLTARIRTLEEELEAAHAATTEVIPMSLAFCRHCCGGNLRRYHAILL